MSRVKTRRLAIIPMAILGLLICWQLTRSILRIWRGGGRMEQLRQEVEVFEEEKRRLEEEKGDYQTEEFIEEQARNKLQMVKEGERMVILPRSQVGEEGAEGQEGSEGEEKNWELWLDYWRD